MNHQPDSSNKSASGLAEDVIRRFGEVRVRVFGTSMVPSILPGSLISVQRADVSEISSGEIVLYSREGRFFAHRVVARTCIDEQPALITRGDRLCYDDSPITSTELLGRVTSIQYGEGRGERQVQPAARLGASKRVILQILQRSDCATYLYLRLASFWPSLFSGGTSCRA
jgi:signal peptidase I